MSKSSNINLYSSDNLSEKALHIVSVDAKLSLTSPNDFELNAPKFKLAGQTDSAHDIDDLGLYLKTLSNLQGSDSVTQAASIAANLTNISTLDAREQANHSAQATLLGVETSRASSAETVLQTNITSEETRALAAEGVLTSAISTENAAMLTAVAAEETRALAAEGVNASAISALGVVDTTTLASINSMLSDYQNADNTISGLITALTTRVSTLESQIATLLA